MNKTCADCIHLKVCEDIDDGIQMCYTGYKGCERFKNKSRFIELPCAVGDRVYEIQPIRKRIQAYEVITAKYNGHFWWFDWIIKEKNGICENVQGFVEFQLGKTVFLTKEEAEKALKGGAE